MRCPCCSGATYDACCLPLHQGANATHPSALMRARFSAFTLGKTDFLLSTWHPQTAPKQLQLENDTQWGRLHIHHSTSQHQEGWVQFNAYFHQHDQWGVQEETSYFLLENQQWYYHSGEVSVEPYAPQRNAPCPCGAPKKFKHCCLKRP